MRASSNWINLTAGNYTTFLKVIIEKSFFAFVTLLLANYTTAWSRNLFLHRCFYTELDRMHESVYNCLYYTYLYYSWMWVCVYLIYTWYTVQTMKISIKDFFIKCDQIRRNQRIWSNLLKKSLMEKFHFLCSDNFKNEVFVLLHCYL